MQSIIDDFARSFALRITIVLAMGMVIVFFFAPKVLGLFVGVLGPPLAFAALMGLLTLKRWMFVGTFAGMSVVCGGLALIGWLTNSSVAQSLTPLVLR